jgi:hypothetical protein
MRINMCAHVASHVDAYIYRGINSVLGSSGNHPRKSPSGAFASGTRGSRRHACTPTPVD